MVQPDDPGSLTRAYRGMADGDAAATDDFMLRMEPRLMGLARKIVQELGHGALVSPEDVTQSAMFNFWVWVRQNDRDDGLNRESLWRLIAAFAKRRALKRVEAERAQKRGGGRSSPASQIGAGDRRSELDLDAFPSAKDAESELWHLLGSLSTEDRSILEHILAGHSRAETCDHLGLPRSKVPYVTRRLKYVHKVWQAAERDR